MKKQKKLKKNTSNLCKKLKKCQQNKNLCQKNYNWVMTYKNYKNYIKMILY